VKTIQIDTILRTPLFPATGDTIQWREMTTATIGGERRFYYAAEAPWRILLVLRGAPIDSPVWAPSNIVRCLVGWDDGSAGFVLPENERRRHTKVTMLADPPTAIFLEEVESLVHILFRSPRSDRRGGYRGTQGRRALDANGTHQVCTTLTGDQHAYVLDLGQGDVAAGLRGAVSRAMEADGDARES
jgi:hypothetical protein